MKRSLPFIALLLMVIGCKPTVPSEYIQPDDMEDILYDYHLAEAMAKSQYDNEQDMKRNAYFRSVLQKYDVTEADFDSSLVYYYSHLDRLKDIYGRVNSRLAEEGERVGASVGDLSHYSQYSASGDTANIWMGVSDVLLIPRPVKNRFDFTVKADTTFRLGDAFMLQFMTKYIWQKDHPQAYASICAKYANDSIAQYNVQVMSSTGTTQLRVPANNDSNLKELSGFIYLSNNSKGDIRQLMFISQIQLIRFHNKELQIPTAHETTDSVKTDSLQRVDNPGRDDAAPVRSSAGGGLRSKNAPFRKGGGKN